LFLAACQSTSSLDSLLEDHCEKLIIQNDSYADEFNLVAVDSPFGEILGGNNSHCAICREVSRFIDDEVSVKIVEAVHSYLQGNLEEKFQPPMSEFYLHSMLRRNCQIILIPSSREKAMRLPSLVGAIKMVRRFSVFS
jgi:hypothetical protein